MIEISNIYEQIRKEIEKGTVRHRRCDICGKEIEIPDAGIFSRKNFIVMACKNCYNTKKFLEFFKWATNLKNKFPNFSKKEISELVEDGLNQIFGYDSSIFTIDEWNNLVCNISEFHGIIG